MSSILRPGPGIEIRKYREWIGDDEVTVEQVSLANAPDAFLPPFGISQKRGEPGDVLTVNEYGIVEWQKPYNSDKELREQYPGLQEAWKTLMEALSEYEMVKKMVKENEQGA